MENSDDEYLPARLASQLQMSLLCTNTRLEESDLPFTVVDQVHVWVTFEEEKSFSFWARSLWTYMIPLILKTLPFTGGMKLDGVVHNHFDIQGVFGSANL